MLDNVHEMRVHKEPFSDGDSSELESCAVAALSSSSSSSSPSSSFMFRLLLSTTPLCVFCNSTRLLLAFSAPINLYSHKRTRTYNVLHNIMLSQHMHMRMHSKNCILNKCVSVEWVNG